MLEKIPQVAKAIIAFFAPGAAMLITAITDASDGGTAVTGAEWIGALATAVVVGGTVYAVPNRTPAAGGVIPQQDARAPEVLHPSTYGRVDSSPFLGSSRDPAADSMFRDDAETKRLYDQAGERADAIVEARRAQADPTEVPIARYGDEALPPVSDQSGSSTAPSETGPDTADDDEPWLVLLDDPDGDRHEVEVWGDNTQDALLRADQKLTREGVEGPFVLISIGRKPAPKHEGN